jgi:hypothetical protein
MVPEPFGLLVLGTGVQRNEMCTALWDWGAEHLLRAFAAVDPTRRPTRSRRRTATGIVSTRTHVCLARGYHTVLSVRKLTRGPGAQLHAPRCFLILVYSQAFAVTEMLLPLSPSATIINKLCKGLSSPRLTK